MATVLDNKEMVFHFQPHSPIPDARELYPQQQWALVSALLRRVTILVGTRTSCTGKRFGARPLCDDVSHTCSAFVGPPGTGKTCTTCAAVVSCLQHPGTGRSVGEPLWPSRFLLVLTRAPFCSSDSLGQIAVIAQSNLAVDQLVEQLVRMGVNVLRIGNQATGIAAKYVTLPETCACGTLLCVQLSINCDVCYRAPSLNSAGKARMSQRRFGHARTMRRRRPEDA